MRVRRRQPAGSRGHRAAGMARWGPAQLVRRRHLPGLRTGKTTVAAMLSYVAAGQLGTSQQPVLASLTALLVVQLTMYDTVAHGLQRVLSVLSGVLVAVGVASYVGLTWWSLGTVVAVSIVVGLVLRLGPHLLEVPISAMLVLAVGGAEQAAAGRVYETLVGAVVGVAVNAVIAPPLYVQPASDATADLADRIAGFLRGLAGQLRRGWSRPDADHWLAGARALGAEVARAEVSVARVEQSARLNPRGAQVRAAQPRLRAAFDGLEHGHVSLRGLCRTLFDRTYAVGGSDGATAYDPATRLALAEALESTADALTAVGAVVTGDPPGGPDAPADRAWRTCVGPGTAAAGWTDWVARGTVAVHLQQQRHRRDRLGHLLAVDAQADQATWQQHGSLLAALDRLRVETDAAVRPPTDGWRPTPITDRQRRAARRVRNAAARAAGELRPPLVRRRARRPGAD